MSEIIQNLINYQFASLNPLFPRAQYDKEYEQYEKRKLNRNFNHIKDKYARLKKKTNIKNFIPKQQEESYEEEIQEEEIVDVDILKSAKKQNDFFIFGEKEYEILRMTQLNKEQNNFDEDQLSQDLFLPELKGCTCCKGFVRNCQGDICLSLGECYCSLNHELSREQLNTTLII